VVPVREKLNICVIAAHPDDEILGCGGTIAKHINDGDEVYVLIMAEGITSRNDKRDRKSREKELSELTKAAHEAHEILGTTSLQLLDSPDNRMDSVDFIDIVKIIEKRLAGMSPDIVYTHHWGDLNIDHRITHQAVMTAFRPKPGLSVKKILCFEIPSSTDWQTPNMNTIFSPNYYVNISGTLHQKLKALKSYSSEMNPWPHTRSIEAVEHLAHWRGSSMGLEAAEAFIIVRDIIY